MYGNYDGLGLKSDEELIKEQSISNMIGIMHTVVWDRMTEEEQEKIIAVLHAYANKCAERALKDGSLFPESDRMNR